MHSLTASQKSLLVDDGPRDCACHPYVQQAHHVNSQLSPSGELGMQTLPPVKHASALAEVPISQNLGARRSATRLREGI